jgi:hypothetical protein
MRHTQVQNNPSSAPHEECNLAGGGAPTQPARAQAGQSSSSGVSSRTASSSSGSLVIRRQSGRIEKTSKNPKTNPWNLAPETLEMHESIVQVVSHLEEKNLRYSDLAEMNFPEKLLSLINILIKINGVPASMLHKIFSDLHSTQTREACNVSEGPVQNNVLECWRVHAVLWPHSTQQ